MPKSLICFLLVAIVFGIAFLPVKVLATDSESLARSEITAAEWQIQQASSIIDDFWQNITDCTQREAEKDINLALARLREAKSYLQEGNYNMSLRQACSSLFLAARSKYRVYLNMTNLRIQKANETIQSIPWHLGKPSYAIDILQNATKIYRDQEILSYFESDLYAEDVFQQYESTQYVVYTRMEEAIKELFLNSQSAYNLAAKAEGLGILYQNEQNQIFFSISLTVAACLGLSFVAGIVLGVYSGPRFRRRISNWRKKRRAINIPFEYLSDTERRYCVIIIETSGVLVTAILTLGAITGAVMQQVKFVYTFIGYMFEYALPFILSAILGIATLYIDKKRGKFPDLFDSTVALFISGWFGLSWLFGLAKDYESLAPGWYYILPLSGLLFRFGTSLVISFVIVYLLKKRMRRKGKYLSLLPSSNT